MTVEEKAKAKLAGIIAREGDAGGERLKPYYLEKLIAEIKQEDNFSQFCFDHRIPRRIEA